MSRADEIRSQIEGRIPGAFRRYEQASPPPLETGTMELDQFGIPEGALTQICAAPGISSGSTTLMIAILAQITAKEQDCALVDASDCFDPESAADAGVALQRLLWVRCNQNAGPGKEVRLTPLEQAFKAADILIQNGGFRVIAIDLRDMEEKAVRRVPLSTWFRFSRVVEKIDTSLIFLLPYPAAKSCAALTIQATQGKAHWRSTANAGLETDSNTHGAGKQKAPAHTMLFSGMEFQFEITRDRNRKGAQSVKRLVTKTRWG